MAKPTKVRILEYLYTVSSIPRKQLKLAFQDVAYNTVFRATKELLDSGYIELLSVSKGPTRIKITKAGMDYLSKQKDAVMQANIRSTVTSSSKKERIERVQKTIDMCVASGIKTSQTSNISFSIFSQKEQDEDTVIEFSNLFVDEAVFFRADEITKTIKAENTFGEEITQTQSRVTGLIINKNGLWFVYHSLDKLMKFTKQIELTFTEAVIRFMESSWLVQQYPNFFGFLSAKPKAIIIGNTPSMLPKIFTGRKWGETESDNKQKQKIAAQMGSYENLKFIYSSIEFVPNNDCGRNYLHRTVYMTQAEMLDMCKIWATKFDYDCVAANGMFQLIHTGTSTRVAILLTLNFDMLIHIRNLPEGTSIIIDKVMAEAVSRALLDSLESSALTILMGDAGTAKTFLSLACGLEQTVGEDPKYRSMLVVRPNVKFDETVGFLKGSEAQKINPLIRPIMDNLDQLTAVNSEDYGTKQGKGGKKSKFATEEAEDKIVAPNSYAQYLFDSGKIEAQAMEYMRGRSIRDRYMIIDEAQNMTPLQAFGIISRAGVGTKIILTGDPNQVDNPLLDSKTNGLTYAANAMKGSKVCTQITFEESECERSELAKEAIKRMKIKGKGRESR